MSDWLWFSIMYLHQSQLFFEKIWINKTYPQNFSTPLKIYVIVWHVNNKLLCRKNDIYLK